MPVVAGRGIVDGVEHGTATAYCHRGCRCEACRAGQADAVRKWRQANPEKTKKQRAREKESARRKYQALCQLADAHPGEYLRLLTEP